MNFDGWDEVEEFLLETFMQKSMPFMDFDPENRLEWLVHAQHHGVPTALLDWTTNPLKALFFAVENPEHDKCDGAVFLGEPNNYYTNTSQVGRVNKILCFHSKHINNRIVSQEACFTAFPIPKGFDDFISLNEKTTYDKTDVWNTKKLIISKKSKPALRRELKRLGISHQFLFPGLDGIATSLRMGFNEDWE